MLSTKAHRLARETSLTREEAEHIRRITRAHAASLPPVLAHPGAAATAAAAGSAFAADAASAGATTNPAHAVAGPVQAVTGPGRAVTALELARHGGVYALASRAAASASA